MRLAREEKAQGAIEYILLAGGIIVTVIVVFAIYKKMVKTSATQVENRTNKSIICISYTQTECLSHNDSCYWDSASQACLPKS